MKWLIVGVSFVLLSFGQVLAQGRIGYVNSQKVFAESPEFQEAQTRFDKEVADWNTRAESMNQDVDSIKAEQAKNALIWSGSKRQEVEAFLKAKQDTLQLYLSETFGPNGKAENRMAELSRPIEERIIAIIRRVAIERDFDMVLDVATVSIAFAKESLDLTDDILAEMAKEK